MKSRCTDRTLLSSMPCSADTRSIPPTVARLVFRLMTFDRVTDRDGVHAFDPCPARQAPCEPSRCLQVAPLDQPAIAPPTPDRWQVEADEAVGERDRERL